VTYGTNNEFGFDYLRDNMKYRRRDGAARPLLAIVDEVDSILIDEARTPLIISGPLDDRSELLQHHRQVHPQAREDRLRARREAARRHLTEAATSTWEQDADRGRAAQGRLALRHRQCERVHHVQQALRAHTLFQRDRDYIVKNDEVIIIDEFTAA